MRSNGSVKCKKRNAFSIIESLVYIFLTTMILAFGINLFISMYETYVKSVQISIRYNNYQNFFVNLDSIISEGKLEKIIVDNNTVIFSKSDNQGKIDKVIKSNQGAIYIKYLRGNSVETINTMIQDIDKLEIKRKGKLIYFIIYGTDGKEYIRCV